MTELTKAAVAEAIDQLVQERGPDYVYPTAEAGGCYYSFEDGTPGCLVGAVIAKLDPAAFDQLVTYEAPLDDGNGGISRRKAGSVWSIIREPNTTGLGLVVGEADRSVRDALRAAQSTQDTGGTWEQAREAFIQGLDPRYT